MTAFGASLWPDMKYAPGYAPGGPPPTMPITGVQHSDRITVTHSSLNLLFLFYYCKSAIITRDENQNQNKND